MGRGRWRYCRCCGVCPVCLAYRFCRLRLRERGTRYHVPRDKEEEFVAKPQAARPAAHGTRLQTPAPRVPAPRAPAPPRPRAPRASRLYNSHDSRACPFPRPGTLPASGEDPLPPRGELMRRACLLFALSTLSAPALLAPGRAAASVGDPQVKTDHPWYPGELSCSTFDRLFATQAELYKRVTGRTVATDEDKALASWYWRNLHYAHGEEGQGDCLDAGFDQRREDPRLLERPVRRGLRPVRHHARAVLRRDGRPARPLPRARRRRLRAQQLRGLPHRRRLRLPASGRCSTTTSPPSSTAPTASTCSASRT